LLSGLAAISCVPIRNGSGNAAWFIRVSVFVNQRPRRYFSASAAILHISSILA